MELVASTRSITGTVYESLSIDDTGLTTNKGTAFRVSERGRFPEVGISWSQAAHRTDKHGVALNFSYEFLRRAPSELVSTVVSRIAAYDLDGLFNDAIAFIINGDTDGNTAAPNIHVEALGGVAGTLDYRSYLTWLTSFRPFKPTMIIGRLASILDLLTMPRKDMAGNIVTLNEIAVREALLSGMGGAVTGARGTPGFELFPNLQLRVVDDSVIAATTLLAVDTSSCMERILEVGSDLQETEKFITNQTTTLVMSVQDNFSKIWTNAARSMWYGA